MPEPLVALLTRYGYAAVFVGVLIENAGVPVPGETVLLAAAFFAQRGTLARPWVIGLAVAGAILGDNVGYWIGRRGGRPLLGRHGHLVGLTPARLAVLGGFFSRHGARTILFARFVTGLRVFAALFEGVSGVPWPWFLFYNAAGAVTWATMVGLAGYLFGQSWGVLERWVGRAGLFGIGLVLALVLLAWARRHARRLVDALEARMPAALTLRELLLGAASVGAIGLFAKIAEDVVTRESTGFDRAVSLGLNTEMDDAAFRAINGWAGQLTWLDRSMVLLAQYASLLFGAVLLWLWLRPERAGDRRSADPQGRPVAGADRWGGVSLDRDRAGLDEALETDLRDRAVGGFLDLEELAGRKLNSLTTRLDGALWIRVLTESRTPAARSGAFRQPADGTPRGRRVRLPSPRRHGRHARRPPGSCVAPLGARGSRARGTPQTPRRARQA